MRSLLAALVVLCLTSLCSGLVTNVPEQIRITLGRGPDEYSVSWVTNSSRQSVVHVGVQPFSWLASFRGESSLFTEPSCHTTRALHTAVINIARLPRSRVYYYRVESDGRPGPLLHFRPLPNHHTTTAAEEQGGEEMGGEITRAEIPSKFALFGDLGFLNNNTVFDQLLDLARHEGMDAVFHIGDIAYNIDTDCNRMGDTFYKKVQPLASLVPYVFGPGNHEADKNYGYQTYNARTASGQQVLASNSSSRSVRYFSVNVGLVHFVVIDTDAWTYEEVFDLAPVIYTWLDNDLKSVDRARTPWVVMLGHRLMYCTKSEDGECHGEAEAIRYGIRGAQWGVEQLLLRHGVDVFLGGHTHHNEVTWPVKEGKETQKDYMNPRAPVHIQTGMAGVHEADLFDVPQASWEQWRDMEYIRAFTLMTVHNATHASFDCFGNKRVGVPLNSFTIVQNNHGPFAPADYSTPEHLKLSRDELRAASASVPKNKHEHHAPRAALH